MSKKLSRDEMKEALMGIIQENRDHPPRNAVTFCNKCSLRKIATCKKYPDGIPIEILTQKTPCKEFQEK